MQNIKSLLPGIIGYVLVNYMVYGEPRGWAGVIGAAIFAGLGAALFHTDR